MAWAIKTTLNDWLETTKWLPSDTQNWSFEFEFKFDPIANTSNRGVFENSKYNDGFYCLYVNSIGRLQVWVGASKQNIDGTGFDTDDLYHILKIDCVSGNAEILFDDVSFGTLSGVTPTFADPDFLIGAKKSFGNAPFEGEIKRVKCTDPVTPGNSRDYDPSQSNRSETGVQPTVTDTISANNATGNGMPTDGSVWVDLGGGETSVDATTQNKTITYTTGQHTVELSGEVNALSDTKTINYSIGQHTVSLSGEVNATSDTRAVTYTVGQHSVELTGEINTTTDTKTLNYLVGQHSVTLSGDIEVTTQNKQIDYTIGQHSVQLSGEVNAQSDTKTINYTIGQHQVEISGDVLAVTDTVNIDYLVGQHGVTLQGDVDVLTESKSIVYATGQHQVFIYSDEPQQLSSYQVSYKPDPYQATYKTDSFSVQYKD